ncbi:MAG: hypothetical protein JWO02_3576 [Solirubrobacterales bacterium]|nr:hypothetical protein [Solirubrobacterales bacterium]
MRRLALLCLFIVGGLALVTSAQARYTVGISDQLAKTFTNPKYKALKMTVARYIAPYDVMTDADQLGRLNDWITAAKADKQKVLVSFEHSRTPGKEAKMPSISEYTKQLKAFKKVYGKVVTDISPWNEVNVCQKNGRTEGQPTKICKDPKVAAAVYKAAKKVFPKSKMVVLDFLDGNDPGGAISYVRKFKQAAKPGPKAIWGLHNYSDTNRYSDKTQRTKRLLKEIGKGEVWLTETGGQVTFQKRTVAEGQKYAAKALGCMFDIANRYKQITRVYVYSFNGTPENVGLLFDSGLVADDGVTERMGYAVVKKRKVIKCNK